ncbi:MAG: hypothetical protein E7491_03190 [Ruminococcaceae bacterium]|nr:hypothetical protein [Oscillospiraceae bacterium]
MKSIYTLQNRWRIEEKGLYYYGLRCGENMFKNSIAVSTKQRHILKLLPKSLSENEIKILKPLIDKNIIVRQTELKQTPTSIRNARFCKKCCANDYIIPGMEFDEDGLCPMCKTENNVKELKSVVPIMNDIHVAKKSRFDVAVFYTGGKDSTFLLYYFAKVKKLRVLALTWEIPFMSDCARKSIENAKKHFDNVEFLTRRINDDDLKKIYRKLYELSGNTCACPSLAYVLFYSEMVNERVPYFFAGNEPVQMLGLYYNHMAPKLAYSITENKLMCALINLGRIFTLHPPLRRGQIQTLMTMKQLAYGDHPIKKISGYTNSLVSNVVEAIHQVPHILYPLKKSIKRSSLTGNIPAFVHVDMNEICGGKYDWNKVKDILIKECGWSEPTDDKKALHTSCQIEKCKDHSQFVRFYNCESKIIPFSALEISLASRNCGRTKEEMLYEMENLLGFSLDAPHECGIMIDYFMK